MNQKDLCNMVNALCDVMEGLTPWECDFVSSMYEWEGAYTELQINKIEQLWQRCFE